MISPGRKILLEAGSLVALLEAKLRDPLLTLGPDGVQRLLADSGVLRVTLERHINAAIDILLCVLRWCRVEGDDHARALAFARRFS